MWFSQIARMTKVFLKVQCEFLQDSENLFSFFGCPFFPAINVKGVVTGDKPVQFTGCVDDFLHAGITEFNNGAVLNINQVIVLNTMIGFF